MTARYREPLNRLGLTYPQFLVMQALWEDDASSVNQIGARLDLDSSTLSPLLRRLETMGLVLRRRDQADERSVTVSLSAAGRALRRKAPAVNAEICAATGLSTADYRRLARELRALASRLSDDD